MIKKFSFWIVLVLIASLGSVVLIHWKSLQQLHERTAYLQPLYQRQKIINSLSLNLERYRRMSSGFRKLSPDEMADIKSKLKQSFTHGVAKLSQLDSTNEERSSERALNDEISELITLSAQIEPMLFSKDAYVRSEVQELHDKIFKTLIDLEKSADSRMMTMQSDNSRSESSSVILLIGVGLGILVLICSIILKNYIVYAKPLNRLYQYANDLKKGKPIPKNPPRLPGLFSEIQSALNQLGSEVEEHMRDRHKFILDIVADLKSPLTLLQAGKYLLGGVGEEIPADQQVQAAESVRRGLAIFAGSLDDLNDIVDINRLESRLDESTVDLSELLSDVSKTILGPDAGKRILVSVPPIPVWVTIDARRFERVMIQVLSKVIGTLPKGGNLSISVSQAIQSSFRGVEILIQDAERFKNGRAAAAGPEQDILKHWISENGLSMALSHKIIKAHGGAIMAAGVAGMSVTLIIRLPQERIVSRGLISPPAGELSLPARGLVVQNHSVESKGSGSAV